MVGDEKWLDEQLAKAGKGKYGWAGVNGTALMMMLSIVNGSFDCGNRILRVQAVHRRRAKKVLLSIVDWFEKTPPKKVDVLRRKFYADLEKRFGIISTDGGTVATVDREHKCCGKCKKGSSA